MSAICGSFSFDADSASADSLAPMMRRLADYGPDGSGQWSEGPVALGHQMLHVTPECPLARLPVQGRDGTFVLTADARIDNRRELADKLDIPAGELSQLADGPLILRAYQTWGTDCVDHLIGDFAFALWDSREKRLFCARDHMGLKPFYYFHDSRCFLFASHPLAVLNVDSVPWRLNELAIADHLVGSYGADNTATLFDGIRRLPPAHTLTVTVDGVRPQRYWTADLSREIRCASDGEYVDAYLDHLRRAVNDRVRSAHPVAALLSGGLDSPILACIAAGQLKAAGRPKLTTFSWVLAKDDPWPKQDERHLIEQVHAQEEHIDGQFVLSEGKSPAAAHARGQQMYGGFPLGGSDHIFETAERAQAAGARVLMGGFGGDQLPTSQGEGDLEDLLTAGRWPTFWRQARARARYKGFRTWSLVRGTLGNTYLSWLADRWREPEEDSVHDMLHNRAVVASEFAERGDLPERMRASPRFMTRDLGRLRERQWYSLDRLEPERVAENLGATLVPLQLDYRLPMFDKRLIEYCLALPPEQHRHGWGRHLVRRAAKGILPEALRVRDDKRGASPPDPFRVLASDHENLIMMLDTIGAVPLVNEYVDVHKLRTKIGTEWPQALAEGQTTFPGMGAVMRGFGLACFLTWFQETARNG